MMLRVEKPARKEVAEEELPEVLEKPMDIAAQLTDIESILDVKKCVFSHENTPFL